MSALVEVNLNDKYVQQSGRVFLTGTQALVRLTLMQAMRDQAAGLKTGGFVSGYRGSPLGGLDQQLWKVRELLAQHNIVFKPGLNEDLAATAIWGTQQVGLFPGATVDGVFSMFYAKGPGIDRSGDVLRHANLAGVSAHGGVLALAGDDHLCKSSTTAHQTEFAFADAMIPVLNPANVQEFLDLGLHGFALSRFSGCWVAFKTLADTVDTSASVEVDPLRTPIRLPAETVTPESGRNIFLATHNPLHQEEILHRYKLPAVLAYARENGLDRAIWNRGQRRLGIVTTGKSYLDVMQALEDLHIDEEFAARIGLALYKVAMPWPLERDGIRHFAEGLEEILVVEEKRALIENQLKEQLYNWRADVRPRVVGKNDDAGNLQLPAFGDLTPGRIARVIADRLRRLPGGDALVRDDAHFQARLTFLDAKERALAERETPAVRLPYFCSGCPHNSSTKVPEGSRALAGIGCHYMAQWMDRRTASFTQMGGEGVSWAGQAPFTREQHVFVNLGDGTYNHSGLLAIRAAVAYGVTLTYKILYNGAVAMTGGQPHEGALDVPSIAQQLAGEGISRMCVVSEYPDRYTPAMLPADCSIHGRDEMPALQRSFRETPGVSVIIYDQDCAAEKRRARRRGKLADPPRRVFINELVCEGCGDCGVASNCVSVLPLETEFGRKREIDQSSCNKDYSCLNGFCPSLVTVEGGQLRAGVGAEPGSARAAGLTVPFESLPEPELPGLDDGPYGICLTGVGGTGVVTLGALIGMAAHLEGKGCSVLDMAGLAQKGGPVSTHIRIAARPEDIRAVRISAGGARLILGCDMVVAAGAEIMAKAERGHTKAVINTHAVITGAFTANPDWRFPARRMRSLIEEHLGADACRFVDGTGLATALMGDSIATNLFMLGLAWQAGFVPLSAAALERAIELNGVEVETNRRAFLWGRRAAHDPKAVEKVIARTAPSGTDTPRFAESLEDVVTVRVGFLKAYQNAALARRYKDFVDRVFAREAELPEGRQELSLAVARAYFKLLAVKDEYEVARLFSDPAFSRRLADTFTGDYRVVFHLAPPLMANADPVSGRPVKRRFGPWMMVAFRLLAAMRGLRGRWFDPFSYSAESRLARRLLQDYEADIADILARLDVSNHEAAVSIAALPEKIRGYGHVKEAAADAARNRRETLRRAFNDPGCQSAIRPAAE